MLHKNKASRRADELLGSMKGKIWLLASQISPEFPTEVFRQLEAFAFECYHPGLAAVAALTRFERRPPARLILKYPQVPRWLVYRQAGLAEHSSCRGFALIQWVRLIQSGCRVFVGCQI